MLSTKYITTESTSTDINVGVQDKIIDTEPLNTSDLTLSSDNEEAEVSSKNPSYRSAFAGKTLPENRKPQCTEEEKNNSEKLSNSEVIIKSNTLPKDTNAKLLPADMPINDRDCSIETDSPSKIDQIQPTDMENTEEERGTHGLRLPLARVRKIMKADPYLGIASQDAVFLVAKATVAYLVILVGYASARPEPEAVADPKAGAKPGLHFSDGVVPFGFTPVHPGPLHHGQYPPLDQYHPGQIHHDSIHLPHSEIHKVHVTQSNNIYTPPHVTKTHHTITKLDSYQPHAYPKYEFGYGVQDHYHGTNFGHSERRDGALTQGQYHVLLPDGRLQKVSYYADETGYHPTITYE